MSIAHYGAAKLALVLYGAVAFAVIASDPSVRVALIVAVPGMITGIGTIILALLNRKDAREIRTSQSEMKTSIDGHFTKLLDQKQVLSRSEEHTSELQS